MVCMIADYKQNGIDRNNQYIATGTDNHELAVQVLYNELVSNGNDVQSIIVIWGEHTLEELGRIAAHGPNTCTFGFVYVFEEDILKI